MDGSILFVIDVQNAFLSEKMLRSSPGFINRLNEAIRTFEEHGIPVVFITQDVDIDEFESTMNPDQITDDVDTGDSPIIFTKSEKNAFSNPELHDYLTRNGISTVFIAGLAAEHCVNDTILGALDLEYDVSAIQGCILAEDGKRSLKAKLDEFASLGVMVVTIPVGDRP